MQDMIKQAQQMQKKMSQMQEELNQQVVEASAGGGMVTVKVTGGQEVAEVKIEKDVVDPEDIEMLQDLIQAATNDALKKAKEMVQSEMSKITGGMNIPGLF